VSLSGGTEGSAHHSTQENVITDGEADTLTDRGAATSNRAKDSDPEDSEEELGEHPILLKLFNNQEPISSSQQGLECTGLCVLPAGA
jgi:hypothetical protein